MNDFKAWYLSNGVWANLLQVVTGFGVTAHWLSLSQAAVISSDAPGVLVGLITAGLGAWGLWGRLVATKKIA